MLQTPELHNAEPDPENGVHAEVGHLPYACQSIGLNLACSRSAVQEIQDSHTSNSEEMQDAALAGSDTELVAQTLHGMRVSRPPSMEADSPRKMQSQQATDTEIIIVSLSASAGANCLSSTTVDGQGLP